MADRTVRAIFEARVSGAKKGMLDLSKDVDAAGRKVDTLSKDLKGLDAQKVKPKVDVEIEAARRRVKDVTAELSALRGLEVTPEVTANIKKAQTQLAQAKAELRALDGAKADLLVVATGDTDDVESKLYDLRGLGKEAGEGIGGNIASTIVSAVTSAGVAVAIDDALEGQFSNAGKAASAAVLDPLADARKRLGDLKANLADLQAMKVTPEVAVEIKQARAQIRAVKAEIKELESVKTEVKIDASIVDAKDRLKELTLRLGELRTLDATPEVDADIKAAQKNIREVRAELRDLNGAKAEMKVTADTSPAKKEVAGLADDIGDAGQDAGDDAGQGIASGIVDAIRTIPIAGAIVGIGVAIAGGLLLGIQQGLEIEAERDLFSAQTGLDEDTSARFGRAAGEAYANAWGESVAANLDTARKALQAGLIDTDATDVEIENVIAKLQGLSDLFDYDIATSVRGVGNLMKTGLVKDADQAFDLITAASQKLPSDDLMDTLNEYSNQFVTLGIKGPEAFGLLVQAAKAGARDTDNVADTFKEMGLRIREGTKPATDALKLLGLNSGDIVKAFQEGGPRAAEAIDKVFDALRKLDEKGGNTQAVVTNLFGGPGEDLGAALFALDIDKASEALSGAEGAAGAADRALTTMSDNTAAKMESAKRNVEIAMDGIKGALAEAFSDEIGGAADWVSKNRAPLMEFFLGVINGTLDMAEAFAEFGASSLDTIADLADGLADFIASIPFVDDSLSDALHGVADSARGGAETIRREVPAALDEVRDKANDWAAPEILKARVHDATAAMTADMEDFVAEVGEKDLTVTINGDKMNAEEVLAELVENVNAEDGTVIINGDKVPAEEALDRILANIKTGEENVTIGADAGPAEKSLGRVKGKISAAEAAMRISADTTSAEESLIALRRKYSKMGIRVSGVSSEGGVHEGGWIARGLHAGGRVRGIDPGYDNVLWPLNTGGRTLVQPLAGGEYVVNSKDSAYWAPLLEWINGGGRPTTHTEDNRMPITIGQVVTQDVDSFRRKAERDRAAAYAANRSAS